MSGLLPLALVGVTLAAAGCGGDEPAPEETVSGPSGAGGAASGMIELHLETTITSGGSRFSEAYAVDGPFELSHGEAPRFDLRLTVDASDAPAESVGLASSGDSGYLELPVGSYQIEPQLFDRLAQPFEAGRDPFGQLAPSEWFAGAAHEESEELDGVDTAHRSGAANLRALLADLRRLTGMLGLPPPPLLGGPRESGTLDVFTGADDDVLRRLAVMIPRAGELEDGQAYEQEIKASLTLSEVDEAQEIEPPMDAPPVSDLEGGQVADKLSGLVEFLDDDGGPGRR